MINLPRSLPPHLSLIRWAATAPPATSPLAESGPYHMGMRTLKFVDESREDRQVSVAVWYPAVGPADETSTGATRDAEPDRR